MAVELTTIETGDPGHDVPKNVEAVLRTAVPDGLAELDVPISIPTDRINAVARSDWRSGAIPRIDVKHFGEALGPVDSDQGLVTMQAVAVEVLLIADRRSSKEQSAFDHLEVIAGVIRSALLDDQYTPGESSGRGACNGWALQIGGFDSRPQEGEFESDRIVGYTFAVVYERLATQLNPERWAGDRPQSGS